MGKAIGGVPRAVALSEEPGGEGRRGAPPSASRGPESIGAYLARQRELRGISLEEVEALTHIPRRSLERLEAGLHDRDPDGFVRGFVRTVSEAIGLDAEDTVARMLAEPSAEGAARHLSAGRVGLVLAVAGGIALAGVLMPEVLRLREAPPPATPAASAPPSAAEAAASLPGPLPARTAPELPPVRWDAVRELAASVGALSEPGAAASGSEPPGSAPAGAESAAAAVAPGAEARGLPSGGAGDPHPGPGAALGRLR